MMLSQTDAKHRLGRARRIAAAVLGAAALALVGASAASASIAYIGNAEKNVVTSINLATKAKKEIEVGEPTSWIAITPNGLFAYAPSPKGDKGGKDTLIPIDLENTEKPEAPIKLAKNSETLEPEDVAITPNGKYVYVVDEEVNGSHTGALDVVEVGKTSVKTIENVGEEPEGIAFTSNGKYAYVTDKATEGQGKVTVIEHASELADTEARVLPTTINIGKGTGTGSEICDGETEKYPAGRCVEPEKIAIGTVGSKELAYVADGAAGLVTVIELKANPEEDTERTAINVGAASVGGTEPSNIVITGLLAYVTDGTANVVKRIELNTEKGKITTITEVGEEPRGIAVAATEKLVVVTDEGPTEKENVRTIEMTEKATVKEKFTVAGVPDGVAIK